MYGVAPCGHHRRDVPNYSSRSVCFPRSVFQRFPTGRVRETGHRMKFHSESFTVTNRRLGGLGEVTNGRSRVRLQVYTRRKLNFEGNRPESHLRQLIAFVRVH